jgi:thiamine-phosphate pyrophosphorylase
MGSLNSFPLLLITDGFNDETPARVEAACSALPPAAAAVLLRATSLEGRALLAAAERLRPIAPILLVHGRADVAMAAGADGVHLPSRGLDPKQVRRFVPPGFIVGSSTHSLAEAKMAARGGADYVVYGPVFETPGKGAPVGVAALAEVVAASTLPVYALGGVDAARAPQCLQAGARLACIGAVLGRAPSQAAEAARALWRSVQPS